MGNSGQNAQQANKLPMFTMFTGLIGKFTYFLTAWDWLLHPSLEGIGTPWVPHQESHQQPISLDTKPNKMTAAVLNLYGSFLSSSTQYVWQNLNWNFKMAAVILLGLVSNEIGCWWLSWARTHGVPIPSREGCFRPFGWFLKLEIQAHCALPPGYCACL